MAINPDDTAYPAVKQDTMSGLTKREYFAITALAGLLSNPQASTPPYPEEVAARARAYADALVKALNNG